MKIVLMCIFGTFFGASLFASQPVVEGGKVQGASVEAGSQSQSSSGFTKILKLQGLTFHIRATDEGSLNQLTIVPEGLSGGVKETIREEIEGTVSGAEVADINGDGFPELYIYVTSAGSGSYGTLFAYASNRNRSLTPIYLPEISEEKRVGEGYMGHDSFAVEGTRLIRTFPRYSKDDSNANSTGGTREVSYKLEAGEAGWILKIEMYKDLP